MLFSRFASDWLLRFEVSKRPPLPSVCDPIPFPDLTRFAAPAHARLTPAPCCSPVFLGDGMFLARFKGEGNDEIEDEGAFRFVVSKRPPLPSVCQPIPFPHLTHFAAPAHARLTPAPRCSLGFLGEGMILVQTTTQSRVPDEGAFQVAAFEDALTGCDGVVTLSETG